MIFNNQLRFILDQSKIYLANHSFDLPAAGPQNTIHLIQSTRAKTNSENARMRILLL